MKLFTSLFLALSLAGCSGTFELYQPRSPHTFMVTNPTVTPKLASDVLRVYCMNLSTTHSTDVALALALGSVSGASGIPGLVLSDAKFDSLRIVLALTTIVTSATGVYFGSMASGVATTYASSCKDVM